ncbi:MAG TPA: DUF2213 domain-containing protein [Nannocystis sp.]
MLIARLDAASPIRLGATPIQIHPDGYRVYRGRATFGDVVLEYPEFGRNEFRPAAEVLSPEAVESMVGVPFTLHHPDDLLDPVDEEALKEAQHGTVIRAEVDPKSNPPSLVVDVVVHTKTGQHAVESGMLSELSPGYRCKDEPAPPGAKHAGKPYQVVQRGHRYNHLSGVLRARTVLPDGRRARLDEAGGGDWIDALLVGGTAYARGDMDIETQATLTDSPADGTAGEAPRTDAPPATPAGKAEGKPDDETTEDAPDEEEVAAVELTEADLPVPAAEALAAFSEEDAAILKTLSPEGLALLATMAQQMKAEAAEQAVMAGEEVDATPPADPASAPAADATTPSAPVGLTADAVQQMIADAIAKAMSKKDSAPAQPTTDQHRRQALAGLRDLLSDRPPDVTPEEWRVVVKTLARLDGATAPAASPAKPAREVIDQAAVTRQIAESRRMDAEFVAAIRKDGHVGERASIREAATAAFAVIREHLPLLAPAAEDAIKSQRRDAFLQIYAQAEDLRREKLIGAQEGLFAEFFAGQSAAEPARTDAAPGLDSVADLLDSIGRPVAG